MAAAVRSGIASMRIGRDLAWSPRALTEAVRTFTARGMILTG
jgi:hypothetical protein